MAEPTAVGPLRFRTVAISGQQVPGAAPGVVYQNFGDAVNSMAGTAFTATLTGPGVTSSNNSGMFSETSGALGLISRSGFQAPGQAENITFRSFERPTLSPAGQLEFRATMSGSVIGDDSLWSDSFGSLKAFAQTFQQGPGLPNGDQFASFFGPTINSNGSSAFTSRLLGPNIFEFNKSTVWISDSDGPHLVAREGSPAPGMPAGVVFRATAVSGLAFGFPVSNRLGQVGFMGTVTGPGITTANRGGMWVGAPGSLSLAFRAGDAAPGFPAGVTYSPTELGPSQVNLSLNDAGQVAFTSKVQGAGLPTGSVGIWVGVPGALSLVAQSDVPIPSLGGAKIQPAGIGIPSRVILNSEGRVAFYAETTAGTGILSNATNGNLAFIARQGFSAPGLPGYNFGGFLTLPVGMNAHGNIAFTADVSGVGQPNRHGIWATDNLGALKLIAASQSLFEVSPGDFRFISALRIVGGSGVEDGLASALNERGELAFWASFSDGSSGVFVASIPEPCTLSLLSLSAVATVQRVTRRRQRRTCHRSIATHSK